MTNLEKFRYYLKDFESPDHFIDFNYAFATAACLGRKVWLGGEFKIFPNMFILFVADPGIGKSSPGEHATSKLLKSLTTFTYNKEGQPVPTDLVRVAANSTSLEKLIDFIGAAATTVKISEKPLKLYTHSSVTFMQHGEIGSLLKDKTNDLVTFLTDGWDCNDFKRDIVSRSVKPITNMCINLMGSCVPDWLRRGKASEIVNDGFSARMLMIWGDKPRKRSPFYNADKDQQCAFNEVGEHLKQVAQLFGEVTMTDEAKDWWINWVENEYDNRLNNDPRLKHYYARKRIHILKLALNLHFSEKLTMRLDLIDIEEALRWLEKLEMTMHFCLSGTGRNPIAILAEEMLKDIEDSGASGISYKKLLLKHFDGGNMEDFDKALTYLGTTEQVIPVSPIKDGIYRIAPL